MVQRHTRYLWIAILAVLFSVLAPTLTQAVAADSVDYCEFHNLTQAAADVDADADADRAQPSKVPAKHHSGHCAVCASHAHVMAMLASPTPVLLAAAADSLCHVPERQCALVLLPIWPAARPRAPPSQA